MIFLFTKGVPCQAFLCAAILALLMGCSSAKPHHFIYQQEHVLSYAEHAKVGGEDSLHLPANFPEPGSASWRGAMAPQSGEMDQPPLSH